jgi:hypothetical protein
LGPLLDGIGLRLLQAHHGRHAAGLLLDAEHEPTGLPQLEQSLTLTRKAIRKKAIIVQRSAGTPADPAALHLLHAHCQQRRTAVAVSMPGRSGSR